MNKRIREVIFEVLHYYFRINTKFRLSRPELSIVARNRSKFYADMWGDAARHLQADIKNIGGDIFEIGKSGKTLKTWQAETSLDNLIDPILTGNKPLMARLLSDMAIPTPRYLEFEKDGLPDALNFLDEIAGPVVVKPSDGTGGGNSVVTNITDPSRLITAAANARALSGGGRMPHRSR